jgi:hypothetical protein
VVRTRALAMLESAQPLTAHRQAFQYEAGHPYRSEAGHGSEMKPATFRGSSPAQLASVLI